jgi:hypothetical protein
VNSFFDRFGDSRGVAERIINEACDTPSQLFDLHSELRQLYIDKVGAPGVEDCGTAIMCMKHLHVARSIGGNQEPLPVEIGQSSVQDVDSSVSMMSVDSSNVAMGSATHDNETGSNEDVDVSNTLTGPVAHGSGTGNVDTMSVSTASARMNIE